MLNAALQERKKTEIQNDDLLSFSRSGIQRLLQSWIISIILFISPMSSSSNEEL